PNFSSIVATGSRPPYGVRFLPSKSYGVEAPILLGSGCVAWIACLAALFRLCFFPRLTIWVTSLGFCAAELLPPHPRFYSMFSGVTKWSTSAQPSRIRSRVHNSGVTKIAIQGAADAHMVRGTADIYSSLADTPVGVRREV